MKAVNAKGVFLCCKHGIPYLLERGGGSVINVASFVALVGAATSQIAYTASKGAVLALSRELGVQFARQGVRSTRSARGPSRRRCCSGSAAGPGRATSGAASTGRWAGLAKPREIVNAALFLASDESSYVNGVDVLVDGGFTAAYVTPE